MYELFKSLLPKQTDVIIESPYKLIQEVFQGKKPVSYVSSGASEYFREHDYEIGVWWSDEHEVFYGTKIPFKTKVGTPEDDAKEFNGYNTYMKSDND